jgi:hypothetical protein
MRVSKEEPVLPLLPLYEATVHGSEDDDDDNWGQCCELKIFAENFGEKWRL